mmetsp:Transcript_78667/g.141928  ORF Transcript_78667/g.141928 Transcript_78667/m.141928 type:complete len:235 (-) Transcript_78667:2863-3567(-)
MCSASENIIHTQDVDLLSRHGAVSPRSVATVDGGALPRHQEQPPVDRRFHLAQALGAVLPVRMYLCKLLPRAEICSVKEEKMVPVSYGIDEDRDEVVALLEVHQVVVSERLRGFAEQRLRSLSQEPQLVIGTRGVEGKDSPRSIAGKEYLAIVTCLHPANCPKATAAFGPEPGQSVVDSNASVRHLDARRRPDTYIRSNSQLGLLVFHQQVPQVLLEGRINYRHHVTQLLISGK